MIPNWLQNLKWFDQKELQAIISDKKIDYDEVKRKFCLYMVKDISEKLKDCLTGENKIFLHNIELSLSSKPSISDFELIKEKTFNNQKFFLPHTIASVFCNVSNSDELLASLPNVLADYYSINVKFMTKGFLNFLTVKNTEDPNDEEKQLKRLKIIDFRNYLIELLKK